MATKKRSVKRAQPKSRAASALINLTRRQLLAGTAAAGAVAALPKAAAGAQLTAKRPNVNRKQPLEPWSIAPTNAITSSFRTAASGAREKPRPASPQCPS